jgi:hypothetical protein
MRKLALVVVSAAACGSDPYMFPPDARPFPIPDAPVEPDAAAQPSIHIASDGSPLLVKVKDGNGPWLDPSPTPSPAGEVGFDAFVTGPYSVIFVCTDAFGGLNVRQVFQTPDDDRTVVFNCVNALPPGHQVTGHMVQAGSVQAQDSFDRSLFTPDWDFTLFDVVDATVDLIATTSDRIAVRRGVVISGDTAVAAAIDVDQEGTALVPQAFTVANPRPGETFTTAVGFLNASNAHIPARVYLGPADGAKVVPDSALLPGDTQSVSVRANSSGGGGAKSVVRSLRRPFQVGGDAAFPVPDAPKMLGWTAVGGFGAHWQALSGLDRNDFTVTGFNDGAVHNVAATGTWLAATGATSIAIDTTVPGFLPEWQFDFTQPYLRSAFLQSGTVFTVVPTVTVDEQINFDGLLAGAKRKARAATGRVER